MAYALRIDDVTRDATTGSVTFKVTAGTTPLPASWTGSGISWGTVAQTVAALTDPPDLQALTDLLLSLLLKAIKAKFPDVTTAQFRTAIQGRTITLDPNAATVAGLVVVS